MNGIIHESIVIVTPVYEDVEASNKLFKELRRQLGTQIYIVAIDDGSVLQPLNVESLREAGVDGVVIKLKRNVGHQRAIAIGLSYVADRLRDDTHVVIMDSDGEDLPETIPAMLKIIINPEVDIVVAQRKSRVETLRFRVFYLVYRWLFKIFSGRTISFGNFMVMKPSALKRMSAMQELWTHLAGCVLSSKLRIATCPLDRGPRYAGQSKMNFVSLALHGFKGMMVFAEDVLVRVGIACAGVAAMSVIFSIIAIGLKLFSYATPGWFSVALGLLFLVFLQTGALTLMTLMLTGVMRSGIVDKPDYIEFIENLNYANAANRARAKI
jgi:hypothetical protein